MKKNPTLTTHDAFAEVQPNPFWVYGALFLRISLFLLVQLIIFGLSFYLKQNNAWQLSASWWIGSATVVNLITFWLLTRWFKDENTTYFKTIHFEPNTFKKDWWVILIILGLLFPIGFLPNPLLANWLFGDAQAAFDLLLQPLPLSAAIILAVLFPVTIAFAELPLYFGYIMPRLEKLTKNKWLAILLPAFFLAAQHLTLPLVLDGRFILWRLLMFLPFAIFLGIVIHWRKRLLPYLMIIHGLMDLGTCILLITLSV